MSQKVLPVWRSLLFVPMTQRRFVALVFRCSLHSPSGLL